LNLFTTIEVFCFVGLVFGCVFFAWKMAKWKLRCTLLEENLEFAKKSEEELKNSFKALSHDALRQNTQSFLDLAKASLEKYQEGAKSDLEKKHQSFKELVKPVKETLGKLDEGIIKLEKERRTDHVSLKTQVDALMEAKKELTRETSNLVKALRTPIARGRWGEIQLRRVVEMAGMVNQCDFFEQTVASQEVRPDLIVKLPGGRQVVIDAKVPLESYLDAIETQDEKVREEKLQNHARLIRSHISNLSKKSYHQHFSPTPEFVVLFLPSETFFSAALQFDPSLIEAGADQGVIIATPTTLIALLRAVAYGWKQESLSRHAEEVSALGHELYKRIVDMSSHFAKMGRGLTTAVDAYNKGVGSLETRVLVTARKFKEMGAAATKLELEAVEVVEKKARELEPL
jgi:DNA recombination protein RmuC